LKKYIAISLLVILAAPQMLRLSIMVQWKANQTYIAANFCENRQKVEMKCDGKCYLRKQLAQLENDSPTTPISSENEQTVKSLEFGPFLIQDAPFNLFSASAESSSGETFPGVLLGYRFIFISSFFDPPDYAV
jgi:hypothetical protein